MHANRVRRSLRLFAAAAAAVILAVGLASPAHAQDCNGALNISIPSPKAIPPTGPYLNVGDSTTVKLNLGSGTITGGTQITLRRLRYELDCNHGAALGVPCTDQGPIMTYDFTQTVASGGALVQCQGHTWTATAGSSANEVVFTPDTPIVLAPEQSASPTLNNCFISFKVKLDNLEPTSGATSDDTPQKVEVVAGFSTIFTAGHADAECNNGGSSGVSQSSGIFTCPNCTVDQCNLGCDTTTGTCKPADMSTPCADTDGNGCTTAGCELNSGVGVCVQTHLFAENSTPCADSDNNACTTAGCNGQGVCDQNHGSKVCPPADECNKGCDATSGQCTPQTSTPCTDTDGNTCTTAGCEVSTTNAELGVCVQTHLFASNSTPCPDTDGSTCTTAGCDGNGVCDQNHVVLCCSLDVKKTACAAAPPPPGAGCTGGAIALTLKYTGQPLSGATTVTVTGSSGASATYNLPSLDPGDVLTSASENDFTIDATAHGQSKLGSKTTVTINGVSEVLHTSCSCKATPETNLALCDPMCLDSSSPDNPTGTKGPPSPLWTLVGLKDPTLGTETCGGTTGGDCKTDLPAGGGDVEYTYTITNTGTTTVQNVTVEDDQLGTIPGSPIASIDAGKSATLSLKQFVAATTLNTVTVTGNGGVCMAEAKAAVVAPCVLGYPFTSQNPRTSVAFNESEVLRAFKPATVGPGERLMVFYNDEHALTLGVRRVLVKSSSGTSMKDFGFTLLMHNPDGVLNPQVGTTDLDGDFAGTDTSSCAGFPDLCDRPLFPALFITDITNDPTSKAGDWQSGVIDPQTGAAAPEATPIPPNAVFGTWKGAVRTLDNTRNPPSVTVTPDSDPAKNSYNLDGGDTAPTGLTNQGYGAEIAWDVDALLAAGAIQQGHVYRVQFMVHDGDQNKVGGDTGEGCATVFVEETATP